MNIIIPMAGMGKRMRPHTLTVPKPLVPIAGKPIVERLVEDIVKVCTEQIDNIGFVIGRNFGEDVEADLKGIAEKSGAQGHIFYQDEALGTAHAIYCAKEILEGNTVVAFADTLFKADFTLDVEKDGIIWVKQVEDPSAFGVVQLDDDKQITAFVEKPKSFVSDLAIIGIYYFKKGEDLRAEIAELIDHKIMDSGEYQLTRVLENLTSKGTKFYPGTVQEWLDCGNKTATVNTNHRYLEYIKDDAGLVDASAQVINSVIIPPVYIGKQARIINSVVGPHVSVGHRTEITDSRVENSIIQKDSEISHAILKDSMIGNQAVFEGKSKTMSVGDFNTITE
ncbi:sugar nucleotidyltransferase [Persicobacter diffluens]|uniref:Nucleotidyltransferase n=1 Tax=Persicobacter diffluens TaxID=981 RepID=A0AAN4VVN1_9BACT|nr:nucleotidyltransferase [Persicobacter diffluens]